jgi:hypothetical protein
MTSGSGTTTPLYFFDHEDTALHAVIRGAAATVNSVGRADVGSRLTRGSAKANHRLRRESASCREAGCAHSRGGVASRRSGHPRYGGVHAARGQAV